MADKDFALKNEDLIARGQGDGDPHAIPNLKTATYKQLKNVQIITDYVFCSLL